MTISFIVFIFDKTCKKTFFILFQLPFEKHIKNAMDWYPDLFFNFWFNYVYYDKGFATRRRFTMVLLVLVSISFINKIFYIFFLFLLCWLAGIPLQRFFKKSKPGRYFLFIIITWILSVNFLLPQLLSKEPSPYEVFNSFPRKENEGKPQKVTFLVDMGEHEVMSGSGGYPAVYLSVHQLGNPSGQKMKDIGGGIWSITLKLKPGVYDYKFRNGRTMNGMDQDGKMVKQLRTAAVVMIVI